MPKYRGDEVPKERRRELVAFQTFREIVAWQRAKSLAILVYQTTKEMPADEGFGLTMQMRRAAVSVAANNVEGFGRGTNPEFAKFCRVARGSLFELMSHVDVATDLQYLPPNDELRELMHETDRVLQGLLRCLEESS